MEMIGENLSTDKSIEANKKAWGNPDAWQDDGERWSEHWGGTGNLYNDVIWPRISEFMTPSQRVILEIAPGYGRITEYLLCDVEFYHGVDLNEICVDYCNERFKEYLWADFLVGDGYTLKEYDDNQFHFVFSWDSLVHCSLDVVASYIKEIYRTLKPGGGAFLHHSNWKDSKAPGNPHWRDTTCSARQIAEFAKSLGFTVEQELIEWGYSYNTDCFTTLRKN